MCEFLQTGSIYINMGLIGHKFYIWDIIMRVYFIGRV